MVQMYNYIIRNYIHHVLIHNYIVHAMELSQEFLSEMLQEILVLGYPGQRIYSGHVCIRIYVRMHYLLLTMRSRFEIFVLYDICLTYVHAYRGSSGRLRLVGSGSPS